MISRSQALHLLQLCDGEEIWSQEYCRQQKVPEPWIRDLRNAYESGFADPSQTIFYEGRVVNQFEGILAVDIALRVARVLGVDTETILRSYSTRARIVRAIQESVEEG